MQKAEVVLSMLSRKSAQNNEYVFDRLYRNLFNPDFYRLACRSIYANEGNLTAGMNGETMDGFNLTLVEETIAQLKQETYRPTPVYRTSRAEKDGTSGSPGIPSFQDRLVQEVLRLLLQAMYEPIFKDISHGFRPGKSCHTALAQLKTTGKGVNWVIEGEITGFSDAVYHVTLLEILSRKMSDGRFLNLIGKFLKAGYMEFRQVHNALTGMPQGELVSSILANISLHELDVFMEQTCDQLTAQKGTRTGNATCQELDLEWGAVRAREKYAQVETPLLKQVGSMRSHDPSGPHSIKVRYIRYACDFVVMIRGDKDLAQHTREDIEAFLAQKVQLELSPEKIRITSLVDRRARFLGYEIARTREDKARADASCGMQKRTLNETIQLLVPGEVIQEKLKPFVRNGKAVHHNARVNLSLLDLVTQYNAEIRGLYNYYCLATDVNKKIGMFRYYHYNSLLKTVARKEKCSIAQVLSKYGVDVKLKQKSGTRKIFGVSYQTKDGIRTITYFNESLKKKDVVREGDLIEVIPHRHYGFASLNANMCEFCDDFASALP